LLNNRPRQLFQTWLWISHFVQGSSPSPGFLASTALNKLYSFNVVMLVVSRRGLCSLWTA